MDRLQRGRAVAQWGLHQPAMLSAAMPSSSGRLSGAILIVAGAYQLTSWKNRCPDALPEPTRIPDDELARWNIGAFRMGFSHGAYCLGCCWALMCVLFVVGVMNLIGVAALTGFALIEKMGPAGAIVARVAGAAMVVLGIVAVA